MMMRWVKLSLASILLAVGAACTSVSHQVATTLHEQGTVIVRDVTMYYAGDESLDQEQKERRIMHADEFLKALRELRESTEDND